MLVAGAGRTINPELERWYATRANSHKVKVAGASRASTLQAERGCIWQQQKDATASVQDSLQLFTDLYIGGADPYLQVLTSQTIVLQNERNDVDIRRGSARKSSRPTTAARKLALTRGERVIRKLRRRNHSN